MKFKNNKRWIFVSLLVLLIITLIIIITYKKIGFIYNTNTKDLKNSQEQESISMDVEIKNVQDNINKCLITFTCNDENEKIKSIQYPGEENNVININNEEGRQKVAIDYEIENGKEDNTFRVTTTSGEVVEKRTIYTIHYDVNGEDASISNGSKTELKGRNTELNEIPTREGYIFFGWSKNMDSKIPEYRNEKYIYQKGDEDITVYAIWIEKIAANSIIEGIEQISETAYKSINVNNETYSTNAIVYDGDLVLDGTKKVEGSTLNNKVYEFGNIDIDVAKENEYAKNMVIFKVKGDLTINGGVTLTSCKSKNGYGGPKGLFIYCTGTLINNGTISMTARGAYAEGQNVYLFKNANESYEYVPDVGSDGGDFISERLYGDGAYINGKIGKSADVNSRKTGGGGSGKAFSYTFNSNSFKSGKGGNGTSYSGGAGGGSALATAANGNRDSVAGNAGLNCGIGGTSFSPQIHYWVYGGVGNPGGTSYGNANAKGNNGTGGLLMVFANSINNNGKITANGVGNGRSNAGGSSGGGSINIFYKNTFTNANENNITAAGGISVNDSKYGKAGNGGNGSVTIGSIETGSFVSK